MAPPDNKADLFGRLFDEALAARNAGDFANAMDICMRALVEVDAPDRRSQAMVYGELGYLHRLQNDDKKSAECYRRSVALSPRSELPSLGLFHSLARQNLWMEALEEAVRFLRNRDSAEYR